MRRYVVDTNLYVRATRDTEWNRGLEAFFEAFAPFLYLHSVVALELLAGSIAPGLERRTRERFIRPFETRGRIITPSHGAWQRAGGALARLVRDHRVSPGAGMPRSLVNDCLIAASARDEGFVLVTANGRDFDMLARLLPLPHVPPWPERTN